MAAESEFNTDDTYYFGHNGYDLGYRYSEYPNGRYYKYYGYNSGTSFQALACLQKCNSDAETTSESEYFYGYGRGQYGSYYYPGFYLSYPSNIYHSLPYR